MNTAALPAPPAGVVGPPPVRPWDQARQFGKRAIVAAFLFSLGSSVYSQWKAWKEFITLPAAFYLELDLEQQALVERTSNNPLSLLRGAAGRELELHHLIQVLQTAKSDERVRGLLAVLGGRESFGGFAQLQELRNALLDFRFHVKGRAPIYAYTNAFGEGGSNGTGLYYMASAADKVFMPPTGTLSLLGFGSTQVFVRGLLDKFKVQPQVFRREEYKAALAPLTGTGYDPAHRENITSLLGSLYDQVVEGIASARRLSPATVQEAVSAAPLLPSQAMQMKLLDGLQYRDQVEQQLLQHLPADAQKALHQPLQPPRGMPIAAAYRSAQLSGPRVSLQRYSLATQWAKGMQQMWGTSSSSSSSSSTSSSSSQQQQRQDQGQAASGSQPPPQAASGPVSGTQQSPRLTLSPPVLPQDMPIVAVVTAAGPIMQTAVGGTDPTGESVVESHKLVRALRGFRDNPQVKAVVLRINSPGGSAVASDMIAREVQLLKDAGKPVVACMADVAASGGYYIAAPCNKILAQPGTITGSIGVIFLKLNVKEALQEYGITGDTVKLGDQADWASGFHQLTTKQQQQLEGIISSTYDDFLSVVAKGRGLSKEAVREVAKGRVWSGSQAVQAGLVDELGGVMRAVELVKQLAGLPEDPEATQTLEWPPRRVPPIVRLLQSTGNMPGSPAEAAASSATAAAAIAMTTGIGAGPVAGSSAASPLAAGLQLVSMFFGYAMGNISSWWHQQCGDEDPAGVLAAGSQSQQQQQPLVSAASRAAGVDQQLHRLMGLVAQQRHQPELFSLEAGMLSESCW